MELFGSELNSLERREPHSGEDLEEIGIAWTLEGSSDIFWRVGRSETYVII